MQSYIRIGQGNGHEHRFNIDFPLARKGCCEFNIVASVSPASASPDNEPCAFAVDLNNSLLRLYVCSDVAEHILTEELFSFIHDEVGQVCDTGIVSAFPKYNTMKTVA